MPAFICIMEFSGADVPRDAYLIHVGEELIGRILKRLREQERADRKKAKRAELSVPYGDSERLAYANGASLRQAIERHVPEGLEKYCR
jgi:hypothetical protein